MTNTGHTTNQELANLNRRISQINEQIRHKQSFIVHNRMDVSDVREAEEEIESLERELHTLTERRNKITAPANRESPQTPAPTPQIPARPIHTPKTQITQSYNAKPHQPTLFSVLDTPIEKTNLVPGDLKRLNELRAQYRILDDLLDKLDERIFACEINVDTNRSADVVAQSNKDCEHYRTKYEETRKTMEGIMAEIRYLERNVRVS